MPEEPYPPFEKMSEEELAHVIDTIGEFHSAQTHATLSQATGLRIGPGSVEEQLTDRKPPREISPDDELIAIDECLGLYRPRRKRIVLFRRGITAAAKIPNCDAEDLQHVVRYHEWGHAILHIGVDKDGRECDLRDYNRIDEHVHESLAQLLAWRAIEQNVRESRNPRVQTRWKKIEDVFTQLEVRQPPAYRSWRRFEKLSVPQLQKTLIVIRRGTRFRDWEGLSVLSE